MFRKCVLTRSGFSLGFASCLDLRSFLISLRGARFRPRLNRRRARACTTSRSCSDERSSSLNRPSQQKSKWRDGSIMDILVEVNTTIGKLSERSLLLKLCNNHSSATTIRNSISPVSLSFQQSLSAISMSRFFCLFVATGMEGNEAYRQPPQRSNGHEISIYSLV